MKLRLFLYLIPVLLLSQTSYSGNAKISDIKDIQRLKISLENGFIHIKGWDKAEIKINAYQKNRFLDDKSLNFILMRTAGMIQLHPEDQSGFYSYDIFVPKDLDLNLTVHNKGFIRVKNSAAEIEANTSSGDIRLNELSGSAIINSQTGSIFVNFKQLSANQHLAFSNSYGSVYVALPLDAKASFQINTVSGDAYSDFSLNLEQNLINQKQSMQSDYLPLYNGQLTGHLNGGGALIPIHTLSGDIYIEKLITESKGANHALN